jgi:N-methylhydantoinase A/acetophenone carboxylase
MNMKNSIDVDVGGTFTDCILVWNEEIVRGKSSTTYGDLSEGFFNSLQSACDKLGIAAEEAVAGADMVRYSTTIATNMLIEREGEKLGLLTTAGHEHVLAIGRSQQWADGLPIREQRDMSKIQRPEPIVPLEMTAGVRERIDYCGEVLIPLQEADAIEKARNLIEKGAERIVVCFLWSFVNPAHEERVKELVEKEFPHIPVVLSSAVNPKWHEYPRANVTIISAYLEKGMKEQLTSTEKKLKGCGYHRPLLIVNNAGGMAQIATTRPVDIYDAGPVAGLLGSAYMGRLYGFDNIITTDMGGTSFDIGIIEDGKAKYYVFRPVIERWLTEISLLEVKAIGAGGGSIAWINEFVGNRLEIGPQSSGSTPGPACYDLGGEDPTVTDADVVLGYIDPEYFLGGRMKLDREKAVRAIEEKIARPLNLDLYEAALSIKKVADAKMGNEIYKETVLRGHDPSRFALFAFGGGGPTHCCGYDDYIGASAIVTSPFASVYCALGGSTIDVVHLYEKSRRFVLLDPTDHSLTSDYGAFNEMVEELQARALEDLGTEGFAQERITFSLELEMRYGAQPHLTRVFSPRLFLKAKEDARAVYEAFAEEYVRRYSKVSAYPEGGASVETFCLRATVFMEKPEFPTFPSQGQDPGKAFKGKRDIYWEEVGGLHPTPIYEHGRLACGNVVQGPAIIESIDTTYVIPKGRTYTTDQYLNGIIRK